MAVREWRSDDDKESKYVFSVHLESGSGGGKDKGKDKDMILKAKTVDLLLQWMNHFAVVRVCVRMRVQGRGSFSEGCQQQQHGVAVEFCFCDLCL